MSLDQKSWKFGVSILFSLIIFFRLTAYSVDVDPNTEDTDNNCHFEIKSRHLGTEGIGPS